MGQKRGGGLRSLPHPAHQQRPHSPCNWTVLSVLPPHVDRVHLFGLSGTQNRASLPGCLPPATTERMTGRVNEGPSLPRRGPGSPVSLCPRPVAQVPHSQDRPCVWSSPGDTLTSIWGHGDEAFLNPSPVPSCRGSKPHQSLSVRHRVCYRNGVGCGDAVGLPGVRGVFTRLCPRACCYFKSVPEVSSRWR